jgi:hypothetical protein
MTTQLTAPTATAGEQIQQAIRDRQNTDYVFDFWTAFGWTVLTFGLYSFYVFFQLVRRSRDHDRRKVALLQAAQDVGWERAVERGVAESLRPTFDQVRRDIEPLRTMTGDFRDPTLWLLFSIVGGGLVWLAGGILLDQDLVRHERHERAAETGLTEVFAALGAALPPPVAAAKQPHNYVGRLLAVVFTLGLYSLWWVADLMREGNESFQQDYAWEDALSNAIAGTASAA